MSTQHPDWCGKRDDPEATALWASNRPALLDVWCSRHLHRLAKVYDVPGVGVRLCLPPFVVKAQAMELGDTDHGQDDAHAHAILLTPDELAAGTATSEFGRCQCGTFAIGRQRLLALLATPAPGGVTRAMRATSTRSARAVAD